MVLEKENRDVVGGEGEGCWAQGERGRHFKFRLLPTIFPPCSHGCSARGGGETAPAGRLAEGKAFSSHFGRQSLPLRDRRPFEILCLASSHLGAGQGLHPGGPAGCSSGVCARNPAQTLQPRRDFSGAVGTSPAKPLPHSTLRAHKWEKLVMRRGKHRD